MKWNIIFEDSFDEEFKELNKEVQDQLLAHALLLAEFGPHLGRPSVDTLKGSRYSNMKELRFKADKGEWRVAFAFDPTRQAILLVAGDKSGVSNSQFYKALIKKADRRFSDFLQISKQEDPHDHDAQK